jgi:hypothetical protein
MGKAIDTVLAFSTQAGAGAFPIALAGAGSDSLTIRSFNRDKKAILQQVVYSAGGAQKLRIISPLLHDNVTGLTFQPSETPSQFIVPPGATIDLAPMDTLTVQGACAGATTITAGLQIYYEDLDGVEARLFSWPDIRSIQKYVKSVEVASGAVAVGAWTDTALTTTENQLHADEYYAVLGWESNQAVDLIGFKGSATGNLRIAGPGTTETLDVSNYFVYMSERTGRPCIPVFNANDRTAFYVSCANHAAIAGATAEVYPILVQLTKRP